VWHGGRLVRALAL